MPVRTYKPTSPGRRKMSVSDFAEITRTSPEPSLVEGLGKSGGRNHYGRVTSWHRGGGHKRLYRRIDFRRDKLGVPAKVASIEYDPNRSAHIALLHYRDGEKRYILAPLGLKVGDPIEAGAGAEIRPGNALPLANIPLGTVVHAVEMKPGNVAVVHHANVHFEHLQVPKDAEYREGKFYAPDGRELTLDDLRGGTSVFNVEEGQIISYVPGRGYEAYWPGVGKVLPGKDSGDWLTWLMHYSPIGKPETDRTRMGLYFAKTPITHPLITSQIAGEMVVEGKIPAMARMVCLAVTPCSSRRIAAPNPTLAARMRSSLCPSTG